MSNESKINFTKELADILCKPYSDENRQKAQELIDKGADVNNNDVIRGAIYANAIPYIELLRENNADFNTEKHHKYLLELASYKDTETLRSVLEAGANPLTHGSYIDKTAMAIFNESAFDQSHYNRNKAVLEEFMDKWKPFAEFLRMVKETHNDEDCEELGSCIESMKQNYDEKTCKIVLQAAMHNTTSPKVWTTLMNHGAHFTDFHKNTLLTYAITGYSSNFLLKYLLQNGADVNTEPYHGHTLLHLAADEGRKEQVEFLLEHLDVNAKDPYGKTPLHIFISQGFKDLDTARLLIDKDTVNAADKNGHTPLHTTFLKHSKGDTKIIELLLKNGALVDTKDHSGLTPLHLAIKNFNYNTIEHSIQFLLKNGANINTIDNKGNTILYTILKENYFNDHGLLDECLSGKFNINPLIKNNDGYKASDITSIPQHLRIKLLSYEEKWLAEHPQDNDHYFIRDEADWGAKWLYYTIGSYKDKMLQDALKAIRLNDQEVIKLLKDHGFNFDEKVYKLAKETASEIYTTPTTLKEKAEKTSSFDNDVKVNPVTEHHKELLPEVSEQPHNE